MVGERGFEPPTPWSRTRVNLIDSVSFRSKKTLKKASDWTQSLDPTGTGKCGCAIQMGMANLVFCANGHRMAYVNSTVSGPTRSQLRVALREERLQLQKASQSFCPECGAPKVANCLNCKALIPSFTRTRPAYCGACGKPYPWTEAALSAAKEFTDELELSADDKTKLKATFDDLAVDNPRTELAAHRFKTFIRKIGPAAGDVLTKIMVNVATEAAKKGMGM